MVTMKGTMNGTDVLARHIPAALPAPDLLIAVSWQAPPLLSMILPFILRSVLCVTSSDKSSFNIKSMSSFTRESESTWITRCVCPRGKELPFAGLPRTRKSRGLF